MPLFTESRSDSADLSLAVRLQRDSAEAWRELIELYGPLVESWAARSGMDPASCEDVVQEVFLTVHRSIGRFDPNVRGATFRGWLWRVTRNMVLQSLRKPQLQARGGSTANRQIAEIAAPCADAVDEDPPSTADDTAALIGRAMEQIKSRVEPITWDAFVRTAVHGQLAAQVAESLGITPAAVRKAKSRTLQRLRKQLGDQM